MEHMNIVRPTLVLNKTICLQNIELMQEKAKRHQLQFRPHFKTHQSIEIGRWYRELGVTQIAVSSVSMASYFASDGWDDITISIPFNINEIKELNTLLKVADINIVVDSPEIVQKLTGIIEKEIGVFIEISTGYNRTGVASTAYPVIDNILDEMSHDQKMTFKGFLSHAGNSYQARSRSEVQNIQFDAMQKLTRLKNTYLEKYPDLIISTGDTPTCSISNNFQNIDEIRPGNFVFYDLTQQVIGACNIDDIAVRMHCPVISKQAVRKEIVIYGGAVHFSKDWIENIDGKPTYGRIIINRNNEKILLGQISYLCRLSQEHGVIRVTSKEFDEIEIGDIVEVIPVHSCLTAHAMGHYTTTKGEIISMMSRF